MRNQTVLMMNSTLRKVQMRLHYPLEVMLTGERRYIAYSLTALVRAVGELEL